MPDAPRPRDRDYLTQLSPPPKIRDYWVPGDALVLRARPRDRTPTDPGGGPAAVGLLRTPGELWMVAALHPRSTGGVPSLLHSILTYEDVSGRDVLDLCVRRYSISRTGIISTNLPPLNIPGGGNWDWTRPLIVPRTVPAVLVAGSPPLLYSRLA